MEHIPARPNTRDPLAVYPDRPSAERDALEVYAPIARRKGYRVRVRQVAVRPSGYYGIYLVAITRKAKRNTRPQ